eukprot:9997332-Karenia_brevis.AAC.1
MLKNGGATLVDALLRLYNDVLLPDAVVAKVWRESTIFVLFKSGGAEPPENYGPIALIPLLYKRFRSSLRS